MADSALSTRERGIALVGRLNRWLIAGAVALSAGLSVAAANAFHGHTRGQSAGASSAAGAVSQQPGSSNGGGGNSSNSGAGGLQPPAQAPSSAPAAPSGGAVSGGS